MSDKKTREKKSPADKSRSGPSSADESTSPLAHNSFDASSNSSRPAHTLSHHPAVPAYHQPGESQRHRHRKSETAALQPAGSILRSEPPELATRLRPGSHPSGKHRRRGWRPEGRPGDHRDPRAEFGVMRTPLVVLSSVQSRK